MARLQFARERMHWTPRHWGQVLHNDETQIMLYRNDERHKVYSKQGEHFVRESELWRGVVDYLGRNLCWMQNWVWGCDGTAAATLKSRPICQYLEIHVMPYAGIGGRDFIFMYDNAYCRNRQEIPSWRRGSKPGLNTIEFLWDELRGVFELPTQPHTPNGAESCCWGKMGNHSATRHSEVNSMPNRMAAIVNALEGNTTYWVDHFFI